MPPEPTGARTSYGPILVPAATVIHGHDYIPTVGHSLHPAQTPSEFLPQASDERNVLARSHKRAGGRSVLVLLRKSKIFCMVLGFTCPLCLMWRMIRRDNLVPLCISRSEKSANARRVSGSALTRRLAYTLTLKSVSWSIGPCSSFRLNSFPQ